MQLSHENLNGSLKDNVSNIRFVAFDTETTGVQAKTDHIVEIAALAFDEEFSHRSFQSLVKPPVSIPMSVQSVHGISDEMVSQAESAEVVLSRFFEFLDWAGEPKVLIAHNCGFDVSFVHSECSRFQSLKRSTYSKGKVDIVLDSCVIAKSLLPELKSHKLSSLGEHFKIQTKTPYHRAQADVEVLHQVFLRLLSLAADKYATRGEGLTLEHLIEIAGGYHSLSLYDSNVQKSPFSLSPRLQFLESLCGKNTQVGIVYASESSFWGDGVGSTEFRYIIPIKIKVKGFKILVDALCLRDNIQKTFRADRILKISETA